MSAGSRSGRPDAVLPGFVSAGGRAPLHRARRAGELIAYGAPLKIFGIGLNKTGTSSLHEALLQLGQRSLHWGGPDVRRRIERARDEGRPLVQDFPDYDAFSDIWALSESFDVLDVQYPGARFILTTRPIESWIDSRRRHVERNREARAQGRYAGDFLEIEPERWRDQYLQHHAKVGQYFAGRDDLLVMDITAGDGYAALCPFLGLTDPGTEFPLRNRR